LKRWTELAQALAEMGGLKSEAQQLDIEFQRKA
jgi:hypothetical protein